MDQRELAIISRLLSSDVKKPTALVHFQRQMSVVEQRIMTLLIFNAQETETDQKGHYEIRAGFVRDFLGWTESKNYERIYDAFRAIKGNDIVWNFLGQDRTLDELICSFLITLGISRRSGIIRYKFHPDLAPIIRNPSVFAKLKLIMLAVLAQPKYAYPLYEFAADAYCRGKMMERISLSRLKEYLGIPATSYTDYVTFKDQVLKPALAAINRVSDYAVAYKTYREGRRVAGIVLQVERKTQWQQPLLLERPLAVMQRFFGEAAVTPDEPGVADFVRSVACHRIDEKTARLAVAAHGLIGAIEVRDKVLTEARRREKGANPVNDLPAYLARCLREGYGKKAVEERAAAGEAEAAVEARREQARARQRSEEMRELEEAERRERVLKFLDTISPKEREKYEARFLAAINAGAYGNAHRGKSLAAPGMARLFICFMADEQVSPRT